jgi:hypothetical protein
MTPLSYVLATSAVPDDSPLSPLSIPHWNSPDPARARAEEPRHRRAIPLTNVSDGAAAHGKFFPPLPELEPALPRSPVPIKGPRQCSREAHHRRYRSQPFSLPLSLGIIRSSANPSHRAREVSGRRWRCCSCKVEESSHRRHSASPPSSSDSPTSSPAVELFLSASAGELLSIPRTMDVRRWILIQRQRTGSRYKTSLTSRSHLPGLKRKPLLPGETLLGRPVQVLSETAQLQ